MESKTFQRKNLVVLGSSFIGMEAASAMYKHFDKVTVIGMENEPFERVLGPKLGEAMRKLHLSKSGDKVNFVMNSVVSQFHGEGSVRSVTIKNMLSNVTIEQEADVVIIGAGIIPDVDFLAGSNIKCMAGPPGGIEVDEFMRTSEEDVFACGDVAAFPMKHGNDPSERTRIEHWDVACDQGRVAAASMLGKKEPYSCIPFFWTQQYGASLRYAGFVRNQDDIIIHGNLDKQVPEFTAYYVKGNLVSSPLYVVPAFHH